jgi:hypothetical protein
MSYLLAEVEMTFQPGREPQWGIRHDAFGVHALSMLDDGGPVRVMVTEQHLGPGSEPTLDDLSQALVAVYGTDYGIHSPTWISRSTDMARQAAAYREGRVLLAGDAAHVHHPVGGQGLNTGVQDAVNLGWKLAQVVNRSAPESLLDTYHAERHPVAARVLRNTMAQIALLRRPDDDRAKALRDTMSELLAMDEPRRRFAAMMSGLDIHYDLGGGHPLLGRRMPDLDLVTASGPLRVFTLLHDARPVLLNFGEPGDLDITPWANRVQLINAHRRPARAKRKPAGAFPSTHVARTRNRNEQPTSGAGEECCRSEWADRPAISRAASRKRVARRDSWIGWHFPKAN